MESSGIRVQELKYITLFVKDLTASIGFYEGLLGLSILHSSHNFALLGLAAGPQLGLHQAKNTEGGQSASVNLHFRVVSVDEAHERLLESGVAIDQPPKDQPWGLRSLSISDPDGHAVELVAPMAGSEK